MNATLYITACTLRNRARRWLRRLREPRYLLGFIAVVAYFYVTVVARLGAARTGRRRRVVAAAVLPALAGAGPAIAGIGLLAAALGSWLLPGRGRLLEFSPAEEQFLFPAPMTRRALLAHRLLRSQTGLLFAALVPSLAFSLPSGSAVIAARTTAAMWILFVTARVFFSGVTQARSHLMSSDPRVRRVARLPLAALLAAGLIVGGALTRALTAQPIASPNDALARIAAISTSRFPTILLSPFVFLISPLFAAGWTVYLIDVARALAVAVVTMGWALASDEVFQGVDSSAAHAAHVQPPHRTTAYRARNAEWILAPTGRPETAFVWKTVLQMLRVVDRRVVMRFILIVVSLSVLIVVMNRSRGLAGVVGVFAAAGAAYAVLLAPQILRLDLRQDLQHLELLKTWPIRAAAVIRGEITGPALALTVLTWGLIGLSLFLSTAAFSTTRAAWRIAISLGTLFLAPALIFGQYAIHNAIAVVFPAWIPLGTGRPRGLDAMGQRLLTLAGTWLLLAVMMLPGALAGAIVWFALYRFVGPPAALVPASMTGAAVMAIEILLMTEALGPAYERLDLLAVEPPD